jgi:hypothetical protein
MIQRLIDGKSSRGSHRSAHQAITIAGKEGGRTVIPLYKSSSNNADHTVVPMTLR